MAAEHACFEVDLQNGPARPITALWQRLLPEQLKTPVSGAGRPALFASNVADDTKARLWDVFLTALPDDQRAVWHACRCCRRFFERYAHMLVVREKMVDSGASLPSHSWPPAADSRKRTKRASKLQVDGDRAFDTLRLESLFFNAEVASHEDLPAVFRPAFAALNALFADARITEAWTPVAVKSADVKHAGRVLGVPRNTVRPKAVVCASVSDDHPVAAGRTYYHLHFTVPSFACREINTAHAIRTLKTMLETCFGENTQEQIEQVHEWLSKHRLSYADRHKAAIGMLRFIGRRLAIADVAQRDLILWHAASAYSQGMISSVRSGMVGQLLGWAREGLDFATVSGKWNALANPIVFMRPTEPPKGGNVAQAEKLMAEMGITEADLARRYLRRDEVPLKNRLWVKGAVAVAAAAGQAQQNAAAAAAVRSAAAASPSQQGLFGRLVMSGVNAVVAAARALSLAPAAGAPIKMNWLTFAARVLPQCAKLELKLPAQMHITFLITGEPGTVPLMQWHSTNSPSRASSFTCPNELPLSTWGLESPAISPDGWGQVHLVCALPSQWEDESGKKSKFPQHGDNYLLALEGARNGMGNPGLCLFPETLRSVFHGVRSSIEAYSKSALLGGTDSLAVTGVAGLVVYPSGQPSGGDSMLLRVMDGGGVSTLYEIPRWGWTSWWE